MAPAAASRSAQSSHGARGVRAANRRPGQRAQPPRGAASGATSPLAVEEVLAAIQSLYMDELMPFGRILRKRLAERAVASRRAAPDIDMDCLQAACAACPWLRVEDLEGGDWAALFTCCPEAFVDIYSPEDTYPAELWRGAAAYFEGLDDDHMILPGGRYSCAQELIGRRLDFLSGYSLGRVSHVVQLAISQKKLLGYLNGAVVPYGRSGSKAKDECAVRQQPLAGASCAAGERPPAEWEQLRGCMRSLMLHVPVDGSMPLSNVKRLFRSRFQMELSETALGHSKLSELLNDPQLQDVCFVKLQGHGYVVVHPQQQQMPHGLPICLSSSIAQGLPPASPVLEEEEGSIHVTFAATPAPPALEEQGSLHISFAEPAPEALEEEGSLHITFVDPERPLRGPAPESSEHRNYRVRNTFVEVEDEPLAQSPFAQGWAAPKRWNTAPGCFGSDLDSDSDEGGDDEDGRGSSELLSAVAESAEGGPDCGVDSCSTRTGAGDEECAGARRGSCSAGGSESDLAQAKASLEPMYLMAVAPPEPDVPGGSVGLVLPPDALGAAAAAAASPRVGPRRLGLTPRTFVVQNTFVHVAQDPETPWAGAAQKAHTTTHAGSLVARVSFGM